MGGELRVHEALKAKPILTVAAAAAATGLSFPTVSSAMRVLADAGIVREATGRLRGRVWVYDRYLSVLSEGTERKEE